MNIVGIDHIYGYVLSYNMSSTWLSLLSLKHYSAVKILVILPVYWFPTGTECEIAYIPGLILDTNNCIHSFLGNVVKSIKASILFNTTCLKQYLHLIVSKVPKLLKKIFSIRFSTQSCKDIHIITNVLLMFSNCFCTSTVCRFHCVTRSGMERGIER